MSCASQCGINAASAADHNFSCGLRLCAYSPTDLLALIDQHAEITKLAREPKHRSTTSHAPSGGQDKRRLKHLRADLIAHFERYLHQITIWHFVLGDILQNANCFRSGLFPGFEQLTVVVGYRAIVILKIEIVPLHFGQRWKPQRTAARSADMKSTNSAKALRPAAMACEYSHWRRSNSQFPGRMVQFRVAWLIG